MTDLFKQFQHYIIEPTEGYVDSYDKVEELIKQFEKETRSRYVCTKRPGPFGKKGGYHD